jgi:hypothetical protein
MTTVCVVRKGGPLAIACEFDKNPAAPVRLHTLKRKG